MQRRLISAVLLLVLSLATTACAQNEAIQLEPDAEGFLHLFNGKDLSGWDIWANKSDFKVVDGVIRSEQGGGGQFMLYRGQEFDDFELVIEWRVSPKGNSGIFIRSPFREWPWSTAYEIQISNEQPPRDDAHCLGSIYAYSPVNPRPDETPERWRTFNIRAEGDLITVVLDGQKINEFNQSTKEETKDKPKSGYIGVQDCHTGEPGTWIEYRVIKVKPL